MIVGLMVGALFAAATAAGIPQYGRSLEIVSMRAAVADVGPFNTNIHVTTSWVPLTEQDRLRSDQSVFSAVESHLGELVIDSARYTKSRLHWWGPLGRPLRTDELASQSSFQYIEDLDDHVEYVTGKAPTDSTSEIDGETVIEVAIYHDRAELLQIKFGEVIDSQPIDRGTGNIRARVTGTFKKIHPDELYWMGFGLAFLSPDIEGREQPLIMFPTRNSMFATVARENAGLPATFDWFLFTDPVVLADMTIDELEIAFENLMADLEDALARPFVITEMIARVDSMKQRALFGSIPLLLMALLILACVGFYLTMAAGLLARRRINGYMMMQSRGFNIRQQLKIHAIESAIVAVPAALIAPLVSFVVIGALGYLPAYRAITGGSAMPVELAVSGWIWSFGASIGTMVLITTASSFWDRSSLAASRSSDARPVSAPWFQRYYVDAFLVGLSGILWWELGARSGVVVAERRGEFVPDLSLLAAPVLIVVAGSLVALRIFPVLTRIAAQVGTRSNSVAVGFGLASVARRPYFHGWPMLAFALAISTGIVAGSVVSTLERSTSEQVLYSTGADIHVTTTGSTGQVDREHLERVRNLGPIDLASPALRTTSVVGTTSIGTRFTLFAIDPIDFQQVAWFRDDFSNSDTTITQLVDRLAVRVLPDAIVLPPNTTEISIWATSSPVIPNHEFWIVVRDGIGDSHTISLGEFKGGWSLESAKIPGFVEPIEITSIQTFLTVGPDSAAPVEVLIDDLIATTGDGSKHMVIDFDSPGLWKGLPTAEGEDTGFTITAEPQNVSGIVEGDAGGGVGSISLGRGSNQGVRGIYRRAVDRPIPLIASEGFMNRTSAGLRRPFVINVEGGLVPVEVIESISYFPTLDPARGPFAVADINAIIDFVELRGRKKVTPNEMFASLRVTDSQAAEPAADIVQSVRKIFRLAYVESRAQRTNDTFVDPVAVAGWRGMSVVATIVAAVIVLMAYAIFLAAYALRTKGESALVLALGVSRRDYWVSIIAELSPAIVIGALVGLATGFAVSSLMVGSMAHTGTGERLLPPFLLQTDWTLPLVTIGAIFTIFLVGVTNSARSFHGIQIARIAREGFSATSI
ncbi:MAG: ABC transporter permease [Chloroflexi bacterium]|nr:ABC transporter permease [Chloroflexota bacterium]